MVRTPLVILIALSGCSGAGQSQQNNAICSTPPSVQIPGDALTCAHRWAYRLAISRDPAPIVAKAVQRACEGVVSYYVQEQYGKADIQTRADVRTEQLAEVESEALMRVVQSRAGGCDIP